MVYRPIGALAVLRAALHPAPVVQVTSGAYRWLRLPSAASPYPLLPFFSPSVSSLPFLVPTIAPALGAASHALEAGAGPWQPHEFRATLAA